MMKDVDGTILEVGDELERVDYFTPYYPKGYKVQLVGNTSIIRDGKEEYIIPHLYWRKVVAAPIKEEIKSPVVTKTVTTTSIVPGLYGTVEVGNLIGPAQYLKEPLRYKVEVSIGTYVGAPKPYFTAQNCLDAAKTLVELAEYLKKLDDGNG